jgi:hypothetical protein
MVDSVAKAICAESATLDWREYRDEARRAIKAMREPTEAIVDRMISSSGIWSDAEPRDFQRAWMRQGWRAAIDAALSEETP